jgi:hypothetical protein
LWVFRPAGDVAHEGSETEGEKLEPLGKGDPLGLVYKEDMKFDDARANGRGVLEDENKER